MTVLERFRLMAQTAAGGALLGFAFWPRWWPAWGWLLAASLFYAWLLRDRSAPA